MMIASFKKASKEYKAGFQTEFSILKRSSEPTASNGTIQSFTL
jgi:hypothetical protein